MLAIPVSVLASRVDTGDRARRLGLFLTPEETDPPTEIRAVAARLAAMTRARGNEFVASIVDPYLNALHRALLRPGRSFRASIRAAHAALFDEACRKGPNGVSTPERRTLFRHADTVAEMHRRVWDEDDPERVAQWNLPTP